LHAYQAILMSDNWRCLFPGKVGIAPGMIPVRVAIDDQYLSPRQLILHHLHHDMHIFRTEQSVKDYQVVIGYHDIGIHLHPFKLSYNVEGTSKDAYTWIAAHLRNQKNSFGYRHLEPLFHGRCLLAVPYL